jgi:hypothetical protein
MCTLCRLGMNSQADTENVLKTRSEHGKDGYVSTYNA